MLLRHALLRDGYKIKMPRARYARERDKMRLHIDAERQQQKRGCKREARRHADICC